MVEVEVGVGMKDGYDLSFRFLDLNLVSVVPLLAFPFFLDFEAGAKG